MSAIKLTYFDFDGGRGEPVRIALHAAKLDFEDHRISFNEFAKSRDDFPFRCAPVLQIDAETYSQSNAMLRFVGKQADLYPADPVQALYCDEVIESAEDLMHHIVHTFGLEGEALKLARQELSHGWLTTFIRGFGELLKRGGGRYFAGNKLSVADIKIYMQVRSLQAGTLDHVPTDLVESVSPALAEHTQRIHDEPIVRSYYDARA